MIIYMSVLGSLLPPYIGVVECVPTTLHHEAHFKPPIAWCSLIVDY